MIDFFIPLLLYVYVRHIVTPLLVDALFYYYLFYVLVEGVLVAGWVVVKKEMLNRNVAEIMIFDKIR